MVVAKAFAAAVSKVFSVESEVEHVLSCERHEQKQMFLQRMFANSFEGSSMGFLVPETSQLRSGPGSLAFDILHQKTRKLPETGELIFGFPCQDVSRLNGNSDAHRTVIKNRSARTGSVLDDILCYVKANLACGDGRHFSGLIMENVLDVAKGPRGVNADTGEPWRTNLDYVNKRVEDLGMSMFTFQLDPRQFGIPVSRGRLFMICLPNWMFQEAGITADEAWAWAADAIDRRCCDTVRNLEDFLLPESSGLVTRAKETAEEIAERREMQGHKTAKQKWPEAHAKALQQAGVDWWESCQPCAATLSKWPGLRALNDRQHELCRIFKISYPDPRVCGMDLSQGFRGTKQVRHNHCEIVTPHGQLFLTSRARFATGLECMYLQQLHFGRDQFKLESDFEEHQPLLQDLAGNAMNSFCLRTRKTRVPDCLVWSSWAAYKLYKLVTVTCYLRFSVLGPPVLIPS